MAGLTEANSDWGSHSFKKRRGRPPPSVTISPPFPGSQRGNQIAQEHVAKEGGTLWYNTMGVDHLYVMNVDKIRKEMLSGFSLTSFETEHRRICLIRHEKQTLS